MTYYRLKLGYLSIDYNVKQEAHYPIIFSQKFGRDILTENNQIFLDLKVSTKNQVEDSLTIIQNLKLDFYPSVFRIEEDLLNNSFALMQEIQANSTSNENYLNKRYNVKAG